MINNENEFYTDSLKQAQEACSVINGLIPVIELELNRSLTIDEKVQAVNSKGGNVISSLKEANSSPETIQQVIQGFEGIRWQLNFIPDVVNGKLMVDENDKIRLESQF